MKVDAVGVNLKVNNNIMKVTKDHKNEIETYIKDDSSYSVSISQEALKMLLEYKELYQIIPKTAEPELHVYNKNGKLA